jgi:hypothetical protein
MKAVKGHCHESFVSRFLVYHPHVDPPIYGIKRLNNLFDFAELINIGYFLLCQRRFCGEERIIFYSDRNLCNLCFFTVVLFSDPSLHLA